MFTCRLRRQLIAGASARGRLLRLWDLCTAVTQVPYSGGQKVREGGGSNTWRSGGAFVTARCCRWRGGQVLELFGPHFLCGGGAVSGIVCSLSALLLVGQLI